jgi:hypothetical protein
MSDMDLTQEEIAAVFARLGLLDESRRKEYMPRPVESEEEIATETSNITSEQIGGGNA